MQEQEEIKVLTPDEEHEEAQKKREQEWKEIEALVMQYQSIFLDEENREASETASLELLQRFAPLFKKYTTLICSGQIDFRDKEMKIFVSSFIDDPSLLRALRRDKTKMEYKVEIQKRFNFIKETYGRLTEDEIMLDLQTMFLTIAKRYKQIGKNFCGYLYNSFHFEVSRHVKKFIKNPLNIVYKNFEYEDAINGEEDMLFEHSLEDSFYEDAMGIPDFTWVSGENCSEIFSDLTPIERKILIKYYLEEWSDRQIAESFSIHINTVNQKRRSAILKLSQRLKIDISEVKRSRRSGKKAILPNS